MSPGTGWRTRSTNNRSPSASGSTGRSRLDELQADLDAYLREYNEQRPHQGRWRLGKTPPKTFLGGLKEAAIPLDSHESPGTLGFVRVSVRLSSGFYSPSSLLRSP